MPHMDIIPTNAKSYLIVGILVIFFIVGTAIIRRR